MRNPFRTHDRSYDDRLERLKLDRMFETRSEAWEAAGLSLGNNERSLHRAQRRALALLPLVVGVLFVWGNRVALFGSCPPHRPGAACVKQLTSTTSTWIEVATAIALVTLGWAFSRDLGHAAAATFFKRMDPATAGTVGFLIRFAAIAITLTFALHVVGLNPSTIAAGGAFTAVIFGLAAQQTLGNVIAGMVLLSARPFRVGERIRLQAGAVGGFTEGIVSSLGLLYTTLARGDDRIMIPNNIVLAAAARPLRPGRGRLR